VFPAAALDEGSGLAMAWRRGQGNMLRLFFGPIVCALPFVIISMVINVVFSALIHVSPAFDALRVVIIAALSFLQAGLAVSFLSFCYRQVVDVRIALPPPMAGLALPAE
jgi:hypothetical protein